MRDTVWCRTCVSEIQWKKNPRQLRSTVQRAARTQLGREVKLAERTAANKIPLLLAVVRQHLIGVLKLRRRDYSVESRGEVVRTKVIATSPARRSDSAREWHSSRLTMVHPEIGGEIVARNLGEATVVTPSEECGQGHADTEVGNENLTTVTGIKDERIGIEVIGELGVGLLARGVAKEVHCLRVSTQSRAERADALGQPRSC